MEEKKLKGSTAKCIRSNYPTSITDPNWVSIAEIEQ
jgi:hypothetical protein